MFFVFVSSFKAVLKLVLSENSRELELLLRYFVDLHSHYGAAHGERNIALLRSKPHFGNSFSAPEV